MVTILFGCPHTSEGHGGSRETTTLPTPSVLRPPTPPPIHAEGRFQISYNDSPFLRNYHSLTQELSENARVALGKWCRAEYLEINNDLMVALDSEDVQYYEVGKTMDAIALRHGEDVAKSIFDLLDKCPVDIYTPQRQIVECDSWGGWMDDDELLIPYPEKTIGALYPRWSWATKKDWFARVHKRPKPRPIPKELRTLMDACDESEIPRLPEWPEPGHVARFPFACITWKAEPWAPKWISERHCADYSTRPDHEGGDPSWIHLLPSYRCGQEEGAVAFTPMPPCHNENDLMQILQSAKPYMKLLDYITDDKY